MADRTKIVTSSLASGGTDTTDIGPIPLNKKFVIKEFGAIGIIDTDSKSTVYLLQWGVVGNFEDVRAIGVTGNTVALQIGKQFTGDGTKFLRVTRQNPSATAKRCPFWIVAYDV